MAVCRSSDFAQFAEQPRVLDGDHCLRGEIRHHSDLFVGEGTDFAARQGERTDQLVLLEHRNIQNCPDAPEFNGCNDGGGALFDVGRVRREIGDVYDRFGRDHTAERSFRTWTKRRALAELGEGGRGVERGKDVQGLAVPAMDIPERGVADADRVLQHGFKHGLEIAGRAGNDLQHLRCGRLLLQRLRKLARALLLGLEQPRVLDRDHRLIGESRDQFDFAVGEGVDAASREPDGADRLTLAHKRDADH